MIYKCELIDYFDVWGNPEDGWEVNNISRENIFYMADNYSNHDMINKLIAIGYLKSDVTMDYIYFLDDGEILEAFKLDDHMPLFRVELEEVKPIAVLALTNCGGIAIYAINEHDEEITYQWYDNNPQTVQYDYEYNEENDKTEAFFLIGQTKYYFNEFMRL